MCGIAGVVTVNTRLAILDLSDRGRMPMSNAEGTVWMTYNSETYNAPELREQLVARGYQFRSASDSEVVLHLYEEYGDRCVENLRGMFAFAIWDGRSNKLMLARDRLSVKPLYVSLSESQLVFGSELKAILPFRRACLFATRLRTTTTIYRSSMLCRWNQAMSQRGRTLHGSRSRTGVWHRWNLRVAHEAQNVSLLNWDTFCLTQ